MIHVYDVYMVEICTVDRIKPLGDSEYKYLMISSISLDTYLVDTLNQVDARLVSLGYKPMHYCSDMAVQ